MTRRIETIHAIVSPSRETRDHITAVLERAAVRAVHVTERELVARLGSVRVLLCGVAPRIDWSSATSLELIQMLGSGVDSLWPADGLPPRVEVANVRGIHLPEMRDHVLTMILAFERELFNLIDQQRRGQWRTTEASTVSGKTVAILGLGAVGRAAAQGCGALGMRVIGMRAGVCPTPFVDEVYGPEALARVLPPADYVVVALPLTAATRGILDASALALCKPSAVVVHVSRGGVVDEAALAAALRAGWLRGAALDVFEQEPVPPASPLWSTPNLVVTPHVAGQVPGYYDRALAVFIDNLACIERGETPRTRVDRRRGY